MDTVNRMLSGVHPETRTASPISGIVTLSTAVHLVNGTGYSHRKKCTFRVVSKSLDENGMDGSRHVFHSAKYQLGRIQISLPTRVNRTHSQ